MITVNGLFRLKCTLSFLELEINVCNSNCYYTIVKCITGYIKLCEPNLWRNSISGSLSQCNNKIIIIYRFYIALFHLSMLKDTLQWLLLSLYHGSTFRAHNRYPIFTAGWTGGVFHLGPLLLRCSSQQIIQSVYRPSYQLLLADYAKPP